MKRSIMVLALCAVLLATAAPVFAASPENPQAMISVTGHAETTVTPDVAYMTAGIVTTGADVESARSENDRVMRRIIDALTAQGIEKKNIVTSQFSLQPIYRNEARDGGTGTITGYRLQNNVTVVIEDLSKIGTVVDATFQAGANQFQGLRFGLKDDSQLREELLRSAVQDGRRKAAVMADALGVSLKAPLSISEGGHYAPVQADSYRSLKAVAGGAPIEAGTLTIGIDVNMAFGI